MIPACLPPRDVSRLVTNPAKPYDFPN